MPEITVSVMVMRKSGNLADYFVHIKSDERWTTPHVFTERYKAQYHADHYRWVLTGVGEDADLLAYSAESYPNYTSEELDIMMPRRYINVKEA